MQYLPKGLRAIFSLWPEIVFCTPANKQNPHSGLIEKIALRGCLKAKISLQVSAIFAPLLNAKFARDS
jgi:hypothetical protein